LLTKVANLKTTGKVFTLVRFLSRLESSPVEAFRVTELAREVMVDLDEAYPCCRAVTRVQAQHFYKYV
jgi:hypothetical protein